VPAGDEQARGEQSIAGAPHTDHAPKLSRDVDIAGRARPAARGRAWDIHRGPVAGALWRALKASRRHALCWRRGVQGGRAMSQSTEPTCPKCGMPKRRWKENNGQGVTKAGETYCCRGCADATGCTC
jgi:hypothetical protein